MTKSISKSGFSDNSRRLADDLFDASRRNNGGYVGEVVEVLKNLRLRVYIRELSLPTAWQGDGGDQEPYDPGFITCEPLLAAAGSTEGENGALSYGAMLPQPQVGDRVAVLYLNGTVPHWFGGIPRNGRTGMGGRYGQCSTDPALDGPQAEATTDFIATSNLQESGLAEDAVRGQGTANAAREDPSTVQGMKTRGNSDKGELGHQFIMDDLPAESGIRWRTSHGHQILISDVTETIYISTAKGKSWVEISQDGKIDIYAEDTLSVHAAKDFNLKVGENFNLDVGKNFSYSVGGDLTEVISGSRSTTIGSFSKQSVNGEYRIETADAYISKARSTNINSMMGTKIASAGNTEIYGGLQVNVDAGISVNMELGLVTPGSDMAVALAGGVSTGNIISQLGNIKGITEGLNDLAPATLSNITDATNLMAEPLQALKASGIDVSGVESALTSVISSSETTLSALTGSMTGGLSGALSAPLNHVDNIIDTNSNTSELFAITASLRETIPSSSPLLNVLNRIETQIDQYPTNFSNSFFKTIEQPNQDLDLNTTLSQLGTELTGGIYTQIEELRSFQQPNTRLSYVLDQITANDRHKINGLIGQLEGAFRSYTTGMTTNVSEGINKTITNTLPNLPSIIGSQYGIFGTGINGLGSNIEHRINSSVNELLGKVLNPVDKVRNQLNGLIAQRDRAINSVRSVLDAANGDAATLLNRITGGLGLPSSVTNALGGIPGLPTVREFANRIPGHEPWRPTARVGPSISTIVEKVVNGAQQIIHVAGGPLPDNYKYLDNMKLPDIVAQARNLYGTDERKDEAIILGWARETGQSGYKSASTSWCGLFMATVAKRAGWEVVDSPLSSRSWATFGSGVATPQLGDVVVFSRGGNPSQGHVALFIKDNGNGTIAVMGGNQSNKVNIINFRKNEVIAYRRPDKKGNMGDTAPVDVDQRNNATVCEVPTTYGTVPTTTDTNTGQRIMIYSGSDASDGGISNLAEIASNFGASVPYHYVIKRNGSMDKAERALSELDKSFREKTRNGDANIKFDIKIKLNGGVKANSSPVKYETNFTNAQYTTLKTICAELTAKYPNLRVWGAWEQGEGGDTPKHPTFGANYWWKSSGNQVISYYNEGTDDDIFWLALTLSLEIGTGDAEAIACVAQVIKNRKDMNLPVGNMNRAWAGTYKGIVLANSQFSCYWFTGWNTGTRRAIPANDFNAAEANARNKLLPSRLSGMAKFTDIGRQVANGTYRGGAAFNAVKNSRVTQYANPAGVVGRRPWMARNLIVATAGGHEFYRKA